jgi:hypothetical protein
LKSFQFWVSYITFLKIPSIFKGLDVSLVWLY